MFNRWLVACALAMVLGGPALAAQKAVLFVVTAADHLTLKDGSTHPTGFYANEFQEPFSAIAAMGYRCDVATPGGKPPPCDPRSLDPKRYPGGAEAAESTRRWLAGLAALKKPLDLAQVHAADYAGIFVPGGHGPMEDLVDNPEMGRLLREALAADVALGLLCHGPAALLSLKGEKAWPFAGYNVTAFSDAEEPAELAGKMKITPEQGLKAAGAKYSKADAKYAPHVVSDRRLVTGQNPASAAQTAKAFLHALGAFHINGPNLDVMRRHQ